MSALRYLRNEREIKSHKDDDLRLQINKLYNRIVENDGDER